mgnify:CR=1 FL=1
MGDPTYLLGGDNGPGFGWQDMTVYKAGVQIAGSNGWTLLQRFIVPLENSDDPYFFPLAMPFDMTVGETVGVKIGG